MTTEQNAEPSLLAKAYGLLVMHSFQTGTHRNLQILLEPHLMVNDPGDAITTYEYDKIAKWSFEAADAFMKARGE